MTLSGELRCRSVLSVEPIAPGAASGSTWLGQTKPQLACEQPWPKPPLSRTVTAHPARHR